VSTSNAQRELKDQKLFTQFPELRISSSGAFRQLTDSESSVSQEYERFQNVQATDKCTTQRGPTEKPALMNPTPTLAVSPTAPPSLIMFLESSGSLSSQNFAIPLTSSLTTLALRAFLWYFRLKTDNFGVSSSIKASILSMTQCYETSNCNAKAHHRT
jgi:hypothetical protein